MLRQLHLDLESGKWLGKILRNVRPEAESVGGNDGGRSIVEFSSPNIAKPFHVGHLRSTILGNFISSILRASGREVTRINYLGDWGTQFGILSEGFSRFGSQSELKGSIKTALHHLHRIYVESNVRAESDADFRSDALKVFRKMEDGEERSLRLWNQAKSISQAEFERIYARLGVEFDLWESESEASRPAAELLRQAASVGTLIDNQGAKCIRSPWNQKLIVLQKQDGTTLYLTRDISTVLSRMERMNPDHIYYVVDSGQSGHFRNLKNSLDALGHKNFADRVHHIPFGMIRGMSSRKGNAIMLDEIIEEGKDLVLRNILKPGITRLEDPEEIAKASQILTNSALFVYDLKRRRRDGYDFRWDLALSLKGDTGIYLQHSFSRLSSLLSNAKDTRCQLDSATLTDEKILRNTSEKEATALISELSAAKRAFQSSLLRLEPSPLVNYLFRLTHLVGRAKKTLRVQEASGELRIARFLLFDTSRLVLAQGLSLLGLEPLDRL